MQSYGYNTFYYTRCKVELNKPTSKSIDPPGYSLTLNSLALNILYSIFCNIVI